MQILLCIEESCAGRACQHQHIAHTTCGRYTPVYIATTELHSLKLASEMTLKGQRANLYSNYST
jgi:hypothetical protein